jgi:hypothetical protein
MERGRLSFQALPNLAHAGVLVTRHPFVEVAFEVHHLADRPGYLFHLHNSHPHTDSIDDTDDYTEVHQNLQTRDENPSSRSVDKPSYVIGPTASSPASAIFFETLSSAAHGVGLVIRTAVRPVGPATSDRFNFPGPRNLEQNVLDSATWVFRGSAQPNPSFLYESTTVLEGLISIENEPRRVLLSHGRAVLEVARKVAYTAVEAASPILSLQSPAQLPQHRFARDDLENRNEDWTRSSSLAVRFSIAIGQKSAENRSKLAEALAEFCSVNGLGMWLRDSRPQHRSGNWFSIVQHEKDRARRYVASLIEGRQTAVNWVCPVTLVGPARVGSTKSVLDVVSLFDPCSTTAYSITSLDDLAFIHFQLALPSGERSAYMAARERMDRFSRQTVQDSVDRKLLDLMACMALGGPTMPAQDALARLLSRAGDYQIFAGPLVPVPADRAGGRPLWLSWEVERSRSGLRLPLNGLAQALSEAQLLPPSARRVTRVGNSILGANFEYLICRDVGNGRLRAKGKLNIPDALWTSLLPGWNRTAAARLLSERLEEGWQEHLGLGPGSSRELTVAWQEHWLGHWSSTS